MKLPFNDHLTVVVKLPLSCAWLSNTVLSEMHGTVAFFCSICSWSHRCKISCGYVYATHWKLKRISQQVQHSPLSSITKKDLDFFSWAPVNTANAQRINANPLQILPRNWRGGNTSKSILPKPGKILPKKIRLISLMNIHAKFSTKSRWDLTWH